MNVLLNPVGSHGDVHPFVGIGRALRDRGHRVTLITAAPFRDLAARNGFDFAAVGTDADYDAFAQNPNLWNPWRSFGVVFDRAAERVYLVDEQAHEVPVDTALLLFLRLIADSGRRGRVAFPITVTSLVDELVAGTGLEVVRTQASLAELTKAMEDLFATFSDSKSVPTRVWIKGNVVVAETVSSSSPARAKLCPSPSSTVVLTFRLVRPGMRNPLDSTALE